MVSANVSFKPLEVPKILQEGEKFIKWDEESGGSVGVPVNVRVDPKGFYLYWTDQNQQVDMLDISTIRDVRTGQYAKVPKDTKLRSVVTFGDGNLEEKTVSVCYGADFVNVSFVNFCCAKEETAQMWTEELFLLAYNMSQLNNPTNMFLQKIHTKVALMADKAGKIQVKNIVKIFAANKEDKKRVEKALSEAGQPTGKNDTLDLAKFQYEHFFAFYKCLTQRTEVEKIFYQLTDGKAHMSAEQLVEFLNVVQRDPRLNEILHPYADMQRARDLITAHEHNKHHQQRSQLTFDGFLRYLMSEDNPIIATTKLELCDDMDQPMSHYFISSSHNTYLTGHQLTGKSSVEIYRQTLLAGCRCVELDFWNGRTEEPVVVHGYTFVPEISAKDVLEAIAETAFKTSEFPVILSFENHCNPRQQAKIAHYCREIFGEMLLDRPLDSHQLEPGGELPPPALLKRKIIIKNKKKHHHHHKKSAAPPCDAEDSRPQGNGDIAHPPLVRQASKESMVSSDSESSSGEEDAAGVEEGAPGAGDADAERETHAGAEISALVNYVQPVHFSSFENAEKKSRYYEMSSFDEKQATTLLKEHPIEFVNYNKHQLSRVYPAGTRFDSSNFMPQVFWNAGCQLVALNFQTLDLAMQLNLGTFEYNRRCGYLLKPEFMRRKDRRLDPFAESTVDGIIAGSLAVTVLSAQLLTDKRCGTYVEVDMFGLPADTVRKKFRTKIVQNNAINPVYGEEPFVFKKMARWNPNEGDMPQSFMDILDDDDSLGGNSDSFEDGSDNSDLEDAALENEDIDEVSDFYANEFDVAEEVVGQFDDAEGDDVVLPQLASIRLAAYEEGGRLIGHRVLPVVGLCPGYRHVGLRTELGQPLVANVFLLIVVKDYVPDGLSELAEALANPIKYQSELDKREQQLAVLTEDTDAPPAEERPDMSPRRRVTDFDLSSHLSLNKGDKSTPAKQASVTGADGSSWSPAKHRSSLAGALEPAEQPPATSASPAHNDDKDHDVQGETESRSDGGGADELVAESVESILACKSVREKRAELARKLDSLRRKHDKERRCNNVSRFYRGTKLVKRLSSKNMTSEPPATPDGEGEAAGASGVEMARAHAAQERELRERYHRAVYHAAEKYMRNSQQAQMKVLGALLERETAEVMRRLQATRREDVKALAKVHRDKDELVRIKRELDSQVVERGVAERVRLAAAYERRREALAQHHERVHRQLQQHKEQELMELEAECGIAPEG